MDQWTGRADEPDTQNVTVKRYFCETHDQLRIHLTEFVMAYDLARRLKTLKGLTPYAFVCRIWTNEPKGFTPNRLRQMPGLND